MQKVSVRGVTLVEFLVAIGVVAVLASLATYTYQKWIGYAESERTLIQLTSLLTVAEDYALSSGRAVTLCKSQSGDTCDGIEWSQGILAFFDENNQHQVTANSDHIKAALDIASARTLTYYGFPSNQYWQYQPKVSKEQQNGTFVYCDNRQTHHDWRLVLSKTGRYRVDRVRDARC